MSNHRNAQGQSLELDDKNLSVTVPNLQLVLNTYHISSWYCYWSRAECGHCNILAVIHPMCPLG